MRFFFFFKKVVLNIKQMNVSFFNFFKIILFYVKRIFFQKGAYDEIFQFFRSLFFFYFYLIDFFMFNFLMFISFKWTGQRSLIEWGFDHHVWNRKPIFTISPKLEIKFTWPITSRENQKKSEKCNSVTYLHNCTCNYAQM